MKNQLISEFIGIYFLYLIIGMCLTPPGAAAFTPLAIAFGLAALIYACGHISKAHLSPAATLAYFITGAHPAKKCLPFILVTLTGAACAAWTVGILKPESIQMIQPLEYDRLQVIIGEFTFTFALIWVMLNIAIAEGTKGNPFYGIAIGGIVGAGAYAIGSLTFAPFNPAVTLGLCINGILPWKALPLYTIVHLIAAATAGLLFKSMKLTDPDAFPAD